MSVSTVTVADGVAICRVSINKLDRFAFAIAEATADRTSVKCSSMPIQNLPAAVVAVLAEPDRVVFDRAFCLVQ